MDELHAAKNWDLYNVLKSSQGFQRQPLAICITTAGSRLDGYPLFEYRKLCIDILYGVKEDDSQFIALYQLDDEDDWMNDNKCWVKANPSLGETISLDYLHDQVKMCKNNPSLIFGVKTKNFNMFCMSEDKWIDRQDLSGCMQDIDIESFRGCACYIGVDLAAVKDLTSITVMIPKDDKPIFKTYVFVPEEEVKVSPNKSLYERWARAGSLIITPGNVTDYDFIVNKIVEINNICPVYGVFYDTWNATQWSIKMTELGYNMQPFSQAIGNYNKPTKTFERMILSGNIILDKSELLLWCFDNVMIKSDHNGNSKPVKGKTKYGKIDPVISILTALGGYLSTPRYSNDLWIV